VKFKSNRYLFILLLIFVALINEPLLAQSTEIANTDEEETVVYTASFFERYSPNTALDMIQQVPGFILDDGSALRGLGAAAGNVLINDRRPSAKQDLSSLILSRIPASQVERIELIRGQIRDIDLQGESVLANIILVDDSDAAISWEALWRHNLDISDTFEGGISISDRWGGIDYNAGFRLRNYTRGDDTFEQDINDIGDLVEIQRDVAFFEGYRGNANLNAETFLGNTLLKFNSTLSGDSRDGTRDIRRTPQPSGNGFRDELLGESFDRRSFEIGTELERNLNPNLQANAILLFILTDLETFSTSRRTDFLGNQTLFRENDTGELSKETIVRFEMDWTGIANHTFQLNTEGAFNSLNGTLTQIDDTGAGPIEINIPGANSRIEETRGDFLLKDTWALGKFELDYGLGVEVSKISQSGDAVAERSFTFFKPQGVMTYTGDQGNQTRLSIFRDVAQLNFSDFVSNAEFEDDDIALGNPDLKPDTTWIAQLLHERRLGEEAVFKVSIFHHWISDVIDLIPITDTFEATGNIGKGRRWGADIEASIPLEWLGLIGARIDLNARWQDSTVVDPVTRENRVLSDRTPSGRMFPLGFRNENKYAISIDYRQDFQNLGYSWGWNINERAERPTFRVNELDILNEGMELNFFIETTRWFNVKMRFNAENVFDTSDIRDRTRFTGRRSLTPVDINELRRRIRGFRISYVLSGNF